MTTTTGSGTARSTMDSDMAWVIAQEKPFVRWANFRLHGAHLWQLPLKEHAADNVIALHHLVEELCSGPIPKWTASPKNVFARLEQVQTLVNFLQHEEGVHLIELEAKRVCEGDQKCMLSLLWALIQNYQLAEERQQKASVRARKEQLEAAKAHLLQWVREKLHLHGLKHIIVDNVTSSFGDGTALLALVSVCHPAHAHRYAAEEQEILATFPTGTERISRALEQATLWYSMPALIDAKDFTPQPSESAMLTYLQCLRQQVGVHAKTFDEAAATALQLEGKEEAKERLRKEAEGLEKERERLRQEADDVAAVAKERERLRKDAEEKEKEQERLRKEVEHLEKEKERLRKEAEEHEKKQETERLRKEAESLETEKERLRKAAEDLEKEKERLRKEAEENERKMETERLRKEAEDLEKERQLKAALSVDQYTYNRIVTLLQNFDQEFHQKLQERMTVAVTLIHGNMDVRSSLMAHVEKLLQAERALFQKATSPLPRCPDVAELSEAFERLLQHQTAEAKSHADEAARRNRLFNTPLSVDEALALMQGPRHPRLHLTQYQAKPYQAFNLNVHFHQK